MRAVLFHAQESRISLVYLQLNGVLPNSPARNIILTSSVSRVGGGWAGGGRGVGGG